MHRCRHEDNEDPYASGVENRRYNRDRFSRDIALHDNITQILRGECGSPFGRHAGMPGRLHGLGPGGYGQVPPFIPYGGAYGHPGFPGPWGLGFYPQPYNDSDQQSLSPWYPLYPSPPPHYGSSPSCTPGCAPRSPFGTRYGGDTRGLYVDTSEHECCQHMPRSCCMHGGHRY